MNYKKGIIHNIFAYYYINKCKGLLYIYIYISTYSGRSLHCVSQSRMHNVLFRSSLPDEQNKNIKLQQSNLKLFLKMLIICAKSFCVHTHSNPLLKFRCGNNRYGSTMFPKLPFQTLLDRHCQTPQ